MSISGGSVRKDGFVTYHTFTSNGTLSVPEDTLVDYLIVGGGGGGGRFDIVRELRTFRNKTYIGGGGGGGEVKKGTLTITKGTYNVTVGSGGDVGENGMETSLSKGNWLLRSIGGGGGGGATNTDGKNGASGGGGGHAYYRTSEPGVYPYGVDKYTSITVGKGGKGIVHYDGATGYAVGHTPGTNFQGRCYVGGGGGAGGKAATEANPHGGPGILVWDEYYGAGGGGMGIFQFGSRKGGSGGSGVGGKGKMWDHKGSPLYRTGPTNGKNGTGSGGGGGGGKGGSGIVIIRVDYGKSQLDTAIAKVQSLQQQIAQRDARIKQLEAQGVTDSAEIRQLKSEKASLESQLATANAEIASLKQQLSQANQTIADQKQRLATLEQQKASLEKQLADMMAAGQASDAQLESLRNTIANLETQIQSTMASIESSSAASIESIRAEYDAKIREYKAAKDAEIVALRDNNAQQVTLLQNKQQQLLQELQNLKNQYDISAAELAAVRAQFSQNTTTLQQRQAEADKLRTQIAEIESNMTATPAPTQTVAPSPGTDSFGSSIYAIIDANAWNETGTLRALTSRNGAIVSEPFRFKDLYQTWVSSTRGKLRSLGGQGEYVGASEGCLVPRGMTETSSTWTFTRLPSHRLHFSIASNECGRRMEQGVADTVVLTTSPESQDGWYVVPIGSRM